VNVEHIIENALFEICKKTTMNAATTTGGCEAAPYCTDWHTRLTSSPRHGFHPNAARGEELRIAVGPK
jgi:hypothetical protein